MLDNWSVARSCTTSRLGFGREADEAGCELVPSGEEPPGAGAEGLLGVELDEAVDGFAGFGVEGFVLLGLEEVFVVEDVAHEAAVFVEDPGEAAGHACPEVESGGT